MSGTLTVRNRLRTKTFNSRLFRRLALTLIRDGFQAIDFELGIYLVGSPEMTRLNEQFLKHQGATDVLAFDYSLGRTERRVGRRRAAEAERRSPLLHGELFVCVDEAWRQARRFRTTWQSELVRYLIHGLLHLHGYEDQDAAARRRMKRQEDHLLRSIGRQFDFGGLGYLH